MATGRKIGVAAVFTVVAGMSLPAMADDPPPLVVVEDIPVSDGYGSNPPDILGIRFGETIPDAKAALQALCPGVEVAEQVFDEKVSDNRGNEVAYEYDFQSACRAEGPPSDSMQVRYTTGAAGARVYQIERSVDYPADAYASMQEVKDAIIAKYGTPTMVLLWPHQNNDEFYYTWEKRQPQTYPTLDMSKRSFRDPDPEAIDRCLGVASWSAYGTPSGDMYDIMAPGTRKGNPGEDACIGAIRFEMVYGNSPDTVRALRVTGTDYDRSMRDAQAADALIAKMVADKASAPGQGAPKL